MIRILQVFENNNKKNSMTFFYQKWLHFLAAFSIGCILGIWQYFPAVDKTSDLPKSNLSQSPTKPSKLNPSALKDTAEIEPLMALKAPEKDVSIQEWYEFALSFDDLSLGKRYQNYGTTTPMLAWYAYIAKYKPQAIYKLYNQGKLGDQKLNHLLMFGFLKYWDEHINDVDKLLLSENQAVLNMAYNKGVDETRRRVAKALFTLSDADISSKYPPELDISNLLFAMKAMTDEEIQRIPNILESGFFRTDPRFLHQLKLSELYKENSHNSKIASLIEQYSQGGQYQKRMMSGYMMDGALLGNQKYIEEMIKDVETNAKQPTNFYCAACGLALATDGLIGYSLVKASKKNKVKIEKNDNDEIILSKKGFFN